MVQAKEQDKFAPYRRQEQTLWKCNLGARNKAVSPISKYLTLDLIFICTDI